jgi:hypothetical protein
VFSVIHIFNVNLKQKMELDRFLDGVMWLDSLPNSRQDAMLLLVSNPQNNKVVKYDVNKEFFINNIGVMEVVNGFVLFDYAFRDGDIVSNIEANVPFDLVIGGAVYNGNNRVLPCICQYHETKIRFYLDPNNLPNRIESTYTVSLLSPDLRSSLSQEPVVLCDDLRYANGMAVAR